MPQCQACGTKDAPLTILLLFHYHCKCIARPTINNKINAYISSASASASASSPSANINIIDDIVIIGHHWPHHHKRVQFRSVQFSTVLLCSVSVSVAFFLFILSILNWINKKTKKKYETQSIYWTLVIHFHAFRHIHMFVLPYSYIHIHICMHLCMINIILWLMKSFVDACWYDLKIFSSSVCNNFYWFSSYRCCCCCCYCICFMKNLNLKSIL